MRDGSAEIDIEGVGEFVATKERVAVSSSDSVATSVFVSVGERRVWLSVKVTVLLSGADMLELFVTDSLSDLLWRGEGVSVRVGIGADVSWRDTVTV